MRPFSTFGVKPFLHLTPEGQSFLQKKFLELSRSSHPDRFVNASDEERQAAESRSAELNADYRVLRDPTLLMEQVVRASGVKPGESKAPPDMAMEYFELQEAWTESDDHSKLKSQVENFRLDVKNRLTKAENTVAMLARQFPWGGDAAWALDDIEKLSRALQEQRYFRRFLEDFEQKFF